MEDNINNGEQQPTTIAGGDTEVVETMLTWIFSTDNDDVIELSNFLEASSEDTCPMKVEIIDDPTWHPLTFQTAASYITINGNEELCGSSFSDSNTSYMAGIGIGIDIATGCGLGGAWSAVAEEARWCTEVNCLVSGSSVV